MASKKMLVVDDEPEIVSVVSMLFKSRGYEVITAENGIRAIQIAIEERPDLLVLDVSMPKGDGHYVAKELSRFEETRSIPIIFLTARTAREDYQMAFDEGVSRYITKPFKHDELLITAEQLMSKNKRKYNGKTTRHSPDDCFKYNRLKKISMKGSKKWQKKS